MSSHTAPRRTSVPIGGRFAVALTENDMIVKKDLMAFAAVLAGAFLSGCGGATDKVSKAVGESVVKGMGDGLHKMVNAPDDQSAPLPLASASEVDGGLNTALMLMLHGGLLNRSLNNNFTQRHPEGYFAEFQESYRDKKLDRDANQRKAVAYIRALASVPKTGVVNTATVLAALNLPVEKLNGKEVSSIHTLRSSNVRAFDLTGTTTRQGVLALLPDRFGLAGFSYRTPEAYSAYINKDGQWYRVDQAATPVDRSHVEALTADDGQGTGIASVLYK